MSQDKAMCTEHSPAPVRELEHAAMKAFRAKYPEAPPWQDLASDTRVMWLRYVEAKPARTDGGVGGVGGDGGEGK